jgi:hypothetical protein
LKTTTTLTLSLSRTTILERFLLNAPKEWRATIRYGGKSQYLGKHGKSPYWYVACGCERPVLPGDQRRQRS